MKPFTITVFDEDSGEVRWKKKQGFWEDAPASAFVDDEGRAAIFHANGNLVIYDQRGERCGRVQLKETSIGEYIDYSTAERNKLNMALQGYFVQMPANDAFCLVGPRGERLLIDLDSGAVRPAEEARQTLDLAERRFAAEVLRDHAELDAERAWTVRRALGIAGRLEMHELLEHIRHWEACDRIGDSWFFANDRPDVHGVAWLREMEPGQVDPHRYDSFPVRRAAQVALRRLGASLAPLRATAIYAIRKDAEYDDRHSADLGMGEASYICSKAERERSRDEPEFELGVSPAAVLELLGAPDEVIEDEDGAWIYDLDGESPKSLYLSWSYSGDGPSRATLESQRLETASWALPLKHIQNGGALSLADGQMGALSWAELEAQMSVDRRS